MLARLRQGVDILRYVCLSFVIGILRPDTEVYDVPGTLPISLDDFALGWARK